jgi:hypothetical protein
MDDARMPRLPRPAEWVRCRNPWHTKTQLIERAKGVLMRRLQMDEQDAYHLLKKGSNGKLAAVAREVIMADEVFALLDRMGGG